MTNTKRATASRALSTAGETGHPTTERQTQISSQEESLQRSIDRVEKAVEALANRIEAVCLESLVGEALKVNEEVALCPLAATLRSRVRQLDRIAERIEGLTERVEL